MSKALIKNNRCPNLSFACKIRKCKLKAMLDSKLTELKQKQ